MSSLRARLEQLESSLAELEREDVAVSVGGDPKNGRPAERQETARVVRIETEGDIK
jgi:hypothetical protein